MTEYDETNRGKVWKNKKKDPENPEYRETLPDFTGELDVDGVKFFVDAWKRKPDANPLAPALNFKVKRKEKQPELRKDTNWDDVDNQIKKESISQRAAANVGRPDPISSGPPKRGLNDDIPF